MPRLSRTAETPVSRHLRHQLVLFNLYSLIRVKVKFELVQERAWRRALMVITIAAVGQREMFGSWAASWGLRRAELRWAASFVSSDASLPAALYFSRVIPLDTYIVLHGSGVIIKFYFFITLIKAQKTAAPTHLLI